MLAKLRGRVLHRRTHSESCVGFQQEVVWEGCTIALDIMYDTQIAVVVAVLYTMQAQDRRWARRMQHLRDQTVFLLQQQAVLLCLLAALDDWDAQTAFSLQITGAALFAAYQHTARPALGRRGPDLPREQGW